MVSANSSASHLGFGPDPPLLHHLRVITCTGDQPDDGVGVADVDGEQHQRGDTSSDTSSGTYAGS